LFFFANEVIFEGFLIARCGQILPTHASLFSASSIDDCHFGCKQKIPKKKDTAKS
jgi:hypothetical protein